jgi:hypothetical protein
VQRGERGEGDHAGPAGEDQVREIDIRPRLAVE